MRVAAAILRPYCDVRPEKLMGTSPPGSIFGRLLDRDARDDRDSAIAFATLPVREQVLDRLADLMLDADDVLAFLDGDGSGELRTIAPEIEEVFDRVNRLRSASVTNAMALRNPSRTQKGNPACAGRFSLY